MFECGFASTDITPDYPIELAGYGYYLKRVSTGILDHLFSKTLVIGNGKTKIVIIANDLLALSAPTVQEIKKIICLQTNIEPEQILISTTHTHSAPQTADMKGVGKLNTRFLEEIKLKISQNAIKACNSLEKTELLYQSVILEGFTRNRDFTGRPLQKQKINIIKVVFPKQTINLIQFSVHPSILANKNTFISKDLVNAFYLYAKSCGVNDILYLNGGCGNIIPAASKRLAYIKSTSEVQGNQAIYKRYINSLATYLKHNLNPKGWLLLSSDKITAKTKTTLLYIDLPRNIKNTLAVQKKYKGYFYKITPSINRLINSRLKELKTKTDLGQLLTTQTASISMLRIADVTLMAYPFEIPIELENELQAKFPNLLIAGYSNGNFGYINANGGPKYGNSRGQLIYNLFPYRKDSYQKLLDTSLDMLKSVP